MPEMAALSLFSGIGGMDLAAETAGIRTAAFCEKDAFCRAVLRERWPDVPVFEDVRSLIGGDDRCRSAADTNHPRGFPLPIAASLQRGWKAESFIVIYDSAVYWKRSLEPLQAWQMPYIHPSLAH